ncbi:TonB-dependent receptor [Sphingobium yanoikuyae]|uniref:TonB-dependent receptor n=1 Tax=Sphingobium yanoikuyae TaxID=13690 RepID=A0AA42X3E3_SPHYA|nr:TonB-dependent receptor [Sphingobium yanoikuyae]MDH2135187.1 TonB-dependent receptor [Sphingobium yanoikuyae]MDH2170525.1 TonB-dependent receptor [Sphingobium yanoikuyae]
MIAYRISNSLNCSMAALALALVTSSPAQAQQVERNDSGLDEIVVTAEKREENLQNVPIAVTAMTGETLTATGISNVEDLQFFVPGVSITNDSMAIINIRGIGTSAFGVATDPSTTVHYDGVYIARPTTSYQDMFDVERIEVLRGPQGVLFGRNSAGGTLNIVSKMPSRELSGTLGVTVGNYDKRTLSGTISGPLNDVARARFTLIKNDRAGIYRDVVTGRRYQNEDNFAGRMTLALEPADNLEIILRADASKDRETGYPSIRGSYPAAFAAAGATIPTRRNDVAFDTPPRYDVDAWGVSSTIGYETDAVALKSITAWRQSKVVQVLDVDATDLFLRNIEFFERSRTFTQELQLLSNGDGALRWIVGAFYLNEKGKDEIRILEPGRALAIPESNTTNAFALFGQATYEIAERARLTAGLRYSYEKKDFAFQVQMNGAQADAGRTSASWTAWTPKFGIDYDLTEDVMAYVSATRGFKSGGFQLGDGKPFLPEYLWSYEVGLKSTLLDRRLRANLSAFYYDYTNLQVVQYINGVASTTNAGQATVKGLEVELMAKPTERLSLSSTLAWLDARYDVYFDQGTSLEGNRLPNAPEWNLTFGAEYSAPLGRLGELVLRADVAWRDAAFFKPNNDPRYAGTGTTLLNGRIAWQPGDKKWEVALYGRNLTNTRYASYKAVGTDVTGVSNPDLPLTLYGEPRQYGIQLRHFF